MTHTPFTVAIIGAGPSGLFAAEHLVKAGCAVHVFEQKPTPARKFLMAGRGGLNITHSEPYEEFVERYAKSKPFLKSALDDFTPADMRAWCDGLGQETFVGTSGRVFPKAMKASPLLRAWLSRLEKDGVQFHYRHTWRGWKDEYELVFATQDKDDATFKADATLLAMGGASWPSLGSDAAWVDWLSQRGVTIAPFVPANCGFHVEWSEYIIQKFSGHPLKSITLTHADKTVPGELMISEKGVEGGVVYALSADIRDAIVQDGCTTVSIDLKPSWTKDIIVQKLNTRPKGKMSFSTWIQKVLGLSPLSIALLQEADRGISKSTHDDVAMAIKGVPLTINAPFSIERAISSAGGIKLDAVGTNYKLSNIPGVFAAGEMLDWEAPTGGYLLQACFATGKAAANGILNWRKQTNMS